MKNFGGNVRFRPRHYYTPRSEEELLDILRRHRAGSIRVIGAGHSWSPLVVTDDTLVDMRHFNHVELIDEPPGRDANEDRGRNAPAANADNATVRVGAGCRIKDLLRALDEHGLTLPSIGLITQQSIAGAAATGTHGSGRHCLSQYVLGARVACYVETGNDPRIVDITTGDELRAARCSLGRLGVVTELTLACVPRYYVEERTVWGDSFAAMLAAKNDWPLQQFYIIPHSWRYVAQRRRVSDANRRRGFAALYRSYWVASIDVGLHLLIKLFERSSRLIRLLYRRIFPVFVFQRWSTTDRSDRQLTMKHHWFRHFELELFVRESDAPATAGFVTDVLKFADDRAHEPSAETRELAATAGLSADLDRIGGTFSHHYPICIRRIVPDDTLISMTSGGDADWYAFSFITYRRPTRDFESVIGFIARVVARTHGARMHWGKWSPLSAEETRSAYPEMETFEAVARGFDAAGVFWLMVDG